MTDEPRGPDPKNLAYLAANMRQMVEGLKTGKLRGGGASAPKLVPTKSCPVCNQTYMKVQALVQQPVGLKSEICPQCASKLREGQTAFTCEKREEILWALTSKYPNMRGKVIQCGVKAFDAIKKQLEGKES